MKKPVNRNKPKESLSTKFNRKQINGIERTLASCSDEFLLERSRNAKNPQIRELAKALLADKDRSKKAASFTDHHDQSVIDVFRNFRFFTS